MVFGLKAGFKSCLVGYKMLKSNLVLVGLRLLQRLRLVILVRYDFDMIKSRICQNVKFKFDFYKIAVLVY